MRGPWKLRGLTVTLLSVLAGALLLAAAFAEKARRPAGPARPVAPGPSSMHDRSGPCRPPPAPPTFGTLERFSSNAEFDRYLRRLRAANELPCYARALAARAAVDAGVLGLLKSSSGSHLASVFGPNAALGADVEDGLGGLTITSNQELGLDEGDIVKATAEHLIVLRQGRLYSLRHRRGGEAVLEPAGRARVAPPRASYQSWYDELLVHGNRIVVIGYSYDLGATELGLFRLAPEGAIAHEATYFLRSEDYFSTRNYASRLLGSRLIFYAPSSLDLDRPAAIAVGRWDPRKRGVASWSPLLAKTEIYRPLQATRYPTLHTLVQCDLGARELRCRAQGLLASSARNFYVSRRAIYLWSSSESDAGGERPALVYRLPLAGGAPTVLRARGAPLDQFSFREIDGELQVLCTATGEGDAMGNPEGAGGRLELLRAPLSAFSSSAAPRAPGVRTLTLPRPDEGSLQNRFVGDFLLYGAGSGWRQSQRNGGRLHVVNLREPGPVRRLGLDHGIDRIEPAGRNAVVVGSGRQDLFFTSIDLRGAPAVRATLVRPDAAQGETRSHGFFFLPDGEGGGMLGLPLRREAPGSHLAIGSAEVLFLQLDRSLRFRTLGSLVARPSRRESESCDVSCTDWYGNARPIFLPGRVLALLGFEVIEGALRAGGLGEWQRTNLQRATLY